MTSRVRTALDASRDTDVLRARQNKGSAKVIVGPTQDDDQDSKLRHAASISGKCLTYYREQKDENRAFFARTCSPRQVYARVSDHPRTCPEVAYA
jgi:hypothetical protein